MLRRLTIASQFTLLLSLIFIGGIALGGLVLSQVLEQKASQEMSDRGQIVMQMVNAVSSYTTHNVAPLIAQVGDPQTDFIPETIPSLAAKKVFNTLKQDWKYKDFTYKAATLNPTNLADGADRFEAKLIEQFSSDRSIKTLSGFRNSTQRLFYSAQPLVVTDTSCLKCHSSPSIAPKSHIELYGTQNGYGWKLNQIVGTRMIYIPASDVFFNARKALFVFINVFIGIFALALISINYLLKWRVIQPLKPMANLAQIISLDTVSAAEVRALERDGLSKIATRTDELGQLGRVFQKMVRQVCDRQQQLSQQLQELRVEIDSSKRIRQVDEITETDYFQKLQQTAKEIRAEWTSDEDK